MVLLTDNSDINYRNTMTLENLMVDQIDNPDTDKLREIEKKYLQIENM